MLDFFKNYIGNFSNLLSLLLVIYFILDVIRNWNGSPEVKIIKNTLDKLTNVISYKFKVE